MVSLADFAAEAAIECGLSLAQARAHSPAQLKLLRRAARRLRADRILADMNAVYAAFTAVMAKGGRRMLENLQTELRKISEE